MANGFLRRSLLRDLKPMALQNVWKDARELIVTNSNFTAAEVDFAATNEKINEFFSQPKVITVYTSRFYC